MTTDYSTSYDDDDDDYINNSNDNNTDWWWVEWDATLYHAKTIITIDRADNKKKVSEQELVKVTLENAVDELMTKSMNKYNNTNKTMLRKDDRTPQSTLKGTENVLFVLCSLFLVTACTFSCIFW